MSNRFRAAAALGLVAASILTVAAPAVADPISNKQAEARRVANKIDQLQEYAGQLAEEYNGVAEELATVGKNVETINAQLASQDASIGSLKSKLSQFALRTYVYGEQVSSPVGSAADVDAIGVAQRSTYAALFLGSSVDTADTMSAVRQDTARLQGQLKVQQAKQTDLSKKVESKRVAALKAIDAAQAYENKLQSDVRALVAQERARQRAADAAAAAARFSRARTVAVGTRGAGINVPPPSPGAAGAVGAARSQLGVPYRFAAASPGVAFDCSGLTMWAWGRSGRSLPHFAASQYAMLPKVPDGALQPGDLVFFGQPIGHVGIYIGAGLMIDAPQTGDVVGIHPLYRGYVGAARP